ncbi:DUF1192 family protein [Oleispirillum naphthae]|uniref:DUF1192 family protein n=1 Tax=Oleispirillum naphthae TaxID=2838853 RepID=UPI0030825FAF
MDDEDDKPRLETGMPAELAALSVEELERWIATFESEIARARAAIAAKKSVRSGADALFSFKREGGSV